MHGNYVDYSFVKLVKRDKYVSNGVNNIWGKISSTSHLRIKCQCTMD